MAQQAEDEHRSGISRMPAATQGLGTRTTIARIPVIMANFANYTLISPKEDVDSMFNGRNWTKDGATGSVRQYFSDQSMGEYDPVFDIYGPVTLSQGYAAYGASGSAGAMVKEACELADELIDFSHYDANDDGYVDLVYVFYAGFGENDITYLKKNQLVPDPENLVWPQYLSNAGAGSYDGKRVTACEYSNELDGYFSTAETKVLAGIGVPCHEFCHALGLPDLYNYDHDEKLMGEWDVMCDGPYNNGSHTPPSLSAYERFFMGWMTPALITEPENLQLKNIATSNTAFLISENDSFDFSQPNTSTYFLLENRQRTGWDIGIPGDGLLLTKIDKPASNWYGINSNPDNLRVDIIEADGLTPDYDPYNLNNGYFGKPGDAFPAGATEYLGIADHAIEHITMTDGVVYFSYRGAEPVWTATIQPVAERQTSKIIRDGQLLICVDGRTYTVLGIQH